MNDIREAYVHEDKTDGCMVLMSLGWEVALNNTPHVHHMLQDAERDIELVEVKMTKDDCMGVGYW